MNETFHIPVNDKLTDAGWKRLEKFMFLIVKELEELSEVYKTEGGKPDFVALADCLADLNVYLNSEAERWGIPLHEVTMIVLDSQESKLDENGQPIWDHEQGKFIKGPNYVAPEPKIAELLEKYR